MANTPDTNTTQLPTDLSYPHQLLEESERDNHVLFPTAPDTPAEAGELDQSLPASSSSGSQLTSSDKLSALPSHLRPSPTGRSATSLRMKSGTLVGSELPSTSETRLPSPPALRAAQPMHHSVSDSAVERETSRQRVSFDSDRGSSTSPRTSEHSPVVDSRARILVEAQRRIYPALQKRLPTASEPILSGSHGSAFASLLARAHDSVHGHRLHDSPHGQGHGHSRKASQSQKNSAESPTQSRSRSPSPSRAVSPLRTFLDRFSPLGRVYSREEPFMPIDPFQFHFSLSLNLFARCFGARARPGDVEEGTAASQTDVSFAFDMFPRQLYLHTQLRLPSLYFSRVARIFQDAAVSRPELQRIIDACEAAGSETTPYRTTGTLLPFPEDWVPPNVSPALARFKLSWETFVASLVREWKTLNVLSALLLSAILTLFQIQDAADDPLTRTAALCSLVSALMSLSFGIMYIVRFDNMRSMYRASRWAEEAQKTETSIFWNVWVLLALPGVWLAWSVLAFVVAIMSFVWRTGAQGQTPSPLSPHAELGPRIGITCQVGLGLVYFILVIRTFRNYGEVGRKARVVQRLADVQIELETRSEWARDRERDEARARAREGEGTREGERGRSRASDRAEPKVNPPGNELGLSGIDRKQEATGANGGDPMDDSYSSLGM
ncbi:hypothetical protein EDB89DRAFT_2074727 [Lactarius sanguifluus]|nr:hypothetical protein EDB89DRAFT_2074727 [Lactarius sanguifluus]